MGGLRKLLIKSPAGLALVVLLVFVLAYLVMGQLRGAKPEAAEVPRPQSAGGPAIRPLPPALTSAAPGAGTAPAPAAKAMPAPVRGETAKSPSVAGVPSGPTGRPDPFTPLVRSGGPSSAQTPPPATLPSPLVTLPPPPLPGGALPPPPLPGGAIPPGSMPGAGGVAVTGIIGDGEAVAVVVIDGRSQILSAGDAVGGLRVVSIDAARRVVRFSRAGKQFDVHMGGE